MGSMNMLSQPHCILLVVLWGILVALDTKVMGSQKAIRLNPRGNNNTQSSFNENPAFIFGTLKQSLFFYIGPICCVKPMYIIWRMHYINKKKKVMVSGRGSSSAEHRFLLHMITLNFEITYVAVHICSNCGMKRKVRCTRKTTGIIFCGPRIFILNSMAIWTAVVRSNLRVGLRSHS